MANESNEDIHPSLKEAREAAKKIKTGGFDDLGARVADEVTQQIASDLNSDDEKRRAHALEKIEETKQRWVQTSGRKEAVGTAGAILTRLMALGIIDEFPQGKVDVFDIRPDVGFLLANLRSEIDGVDYKLIEKESLSFVEGTESHAFAAQYAGSWSGYAMVESFSPPPVESLGAQLKTHARARIGVSAITKGKGIEEKLQENAENWARSQNNKGVWLELGVDDKPTLTIYEKLGYRTVGMYTDTDGRGTIIAAKKFT